MTLGKQSVPLQGFSEEVRELHIYPHFLPYHHEGEITAKICIPSVTIEKADFYTGLSAKNDLSRGRKPFPANSIINPNYTAPDHYSNIREVL
jgi:hypothetical protein